MALCLFWFFCVCVVRCGVLVFQISTDIRRRNIKHYLHRILKSKSKSVRNFWIYLQYISSRLADLWYRIEADRTMAKTCWMCLCIHCHRQQQQQRWRLRRRRHRSVRNNEGIYCMKLYRHYLHNSADTFTIVHIMHIVRVS